MDWTGGNVSYSLDAAGRTNRVALWGGQQLDYSYDAAGNQTVITDTLGFATHYA